MSTIVVVKKAGRAVIAADSVTSFGSTLANDKYLHNWAKIHQCGKSFIGVVGSSAHNNVIRSLARNYPKLLSFNGVDDIFETCRKLHPILKDEYFIVPSDNSDGPSYESSQIRSVVINPHGIFEIDTWREIFSYERFWAIGSGRNYALGAMYAVYDKLETPEQIAEIGVSAGCEFDDGSGLPFTMHSVPLIKSESGKKKPRSQT
jgi:ATP-dependent protease HslVU (ClpYQ) peptidase subunit